MSPYVPLDFLGKPLKIAILWTYIKAQTMKINIRFQTFLSHLSSTYCEMRTTSPLSNFSKSSLAISARAISNTFVWITIWRKFEGETCVKTDLYILLNWVSKLSQTFAPSPAPTLWERKGRNIFRNSYVFPNNVINTALIQKNRIRIIIIFINFTHFKQNDVYMVKNKNIQCNLLILPKILNEIPSKELYVSKTYKKRITKCFFKVYFWAFFKTFWKYVSETFWKYVSETF